MTPIQIVYTPVTLKRPLLPGEDTIRRPLREAIQTHLLPEPTEPEVLIPPGGVNLLQRENQLAGSLRRPTATQGRTHL